MILREELEQREFIALAAGATKSVDSKGRTQEESKCAYRTDFQRDRDRIIHSKAFRRLMHKTQVFLAPEGDHFRTRLTHTLEVSQIARTIARSLGMNEDLAEAIAMGHDLGHTPFGHNGEDFLNERHEKGFKHNVQGLRVVEILENHGTMTGMNLTAEVKDGILNHTGEGRPFTPEGRIVRFSDRIAYINHDIDDALRSGVIQEKDLPPDCVKELGADHRNRINNLVSDLVRNSDDAGNIVMSEEKQFYMNKLREFMFENVYHSKKVKRDEELSKIKAMIFTLYDYFESNPEKLPKEWKTRIPLYGVQEVAKDHIAGMTDRYAVNLFVEIYVPKSWK
ncbi:MAG: deoxyguanosinetriphosphate triphosphohydrolase [Anaerovoracaceae bacterium]